MSAEIVLCHGREYVNTEQGLSLVHDFPNPFSPDSALPAINWKGAWIIITPVAPGAPIVAPRMPSAAALPIFKRETSFLPHTEVIRDDSSLPSPESPSTELRVSLPDPEPAPLVVAEPELVAEIVSPIASPIVPVSIAEVALPRSPPPPARHSEDRKPAIRQPTPQVMQPLSNTEIRMRAPSTRNYTTVEAIREIPRWQEVEQDRLAHSSNRSQYGRNDSQQNRNGRGTSNGRHTPESDYPPQRSGKRSLYDRENLSSGRSQPSHSDYRPPSPRRSSHDRSMPSDRRPSPSYSNDNRPQHNSEFRDRDRYGERDRDPSPPRSHRAPLSASNDRYDSAEAPRSSSSSVSAAASSSTAPAASIFPPLPAELTDRSELERYVASNAGPPNVGPTLTVWVTREGMPQRDLEVEIALSASVSGLKAKLRAITGMPIREQRLALGKIVLHPDHKMSSLKEEIQQGATILLTKRGGEGKIDVETVDGRSHSFEFGPKDFVADLEDAVAEKVFNNVERVRFHLLNGGHRLRRPSTLLAAGVKSGHKVRLVLSVQSG